MDGPDRTTGEQRVAAEALRSFLSRAFARVGVPEADAAQLSDIITAADLRGTYSHGSAMAPGYLGRLARREIDPTARPVVRRDDGGAALVVDGRNAMGHLVVAFAMERAIERAARTGIACVAIAGSNHCGAMAYYPRLALRADMIGLATTNALPTMAPWGGIDRVLGINPVAVAVPADDDHPVVLDTSFGAAAYGKIVIHGKKGTPIPEGWAYDAEGRPTTDPVAALAGLIQPAGRYKGTGFALVAGILSTVLSGAAYGAELGTIETGSAAGADGQLVLAIRVDAFEDAGRFKSRVGSILREIRAGRTAPGFERIYTPGEIEDLTEARYRTEGIPINDATLRELAEAGATVGVNAPWTEGSASGSSGREVV